MNAIDEGEESDASGGTVDLDSQREEPLDSQREEPMSPEMCVDHIQLSNAAFAPSSSGVLHRLLSKHNIDIDSRDQSGYTTLMTCIKHKRRDSALLLLKNGAAVLLVNSQDWSAFHLAASTGDVEVLKALVAAARRASPTALAEALVALPVEDPASASCLCLLPLPPAPCGHCPARRSAVAPQTCLGCRLRSDKTPVLLTPTGGAHAHGQDACGAGDGRGLQGLPQPAASAARERRHHCRASGRHRRLRLRLRHAGCRRRCCSGGSRRGGRGRL